MLQSYIMTTHSLGYHVNNLPYEISEGKESFRKKGIWNLKFNWQEISLTNNFHIYDTCPKGSLFDVLKPCDNQTCAQWTMTNRPTDNSSTRPLANVCGN